MKEFIITITKADGSGTLGTINAKTPREALFILANSPSFDCKDFKSILVSSVPAELRGQ